MSTVSAVKCCNAAPPSPKTYRHVPDRTQAAATKAAVTAAGTHAQSPRTMNSPTGAGLCMAWAG